MRFTESGWPIFYWTRHRLADMAIGYGGCFVTEPLKDGVTLFSCGNQLVKFCCTTKQLDFWNGSHAIPLQRPFLPKLSYHRNVSLAGYLPILYFSFSQKTNLHLYKGARLTLLLFTFLVGFFHGFSFI